MLDFAIAITNVIGVGIKTFDDPGLKKARGHKKSQSQRKRAKNHKGAKKHKRAKNSKRSKNQDKKKKNRGSSKGSEGKVDQRKRKTMQTGIPEVLFFNPEGAIDLQVLLDLW